MRLGVISDTHGLLRPEVFDAFRDVDHILHAGDVGKWEIMNDLRAIAPVTAAYGNTDDSELRGQLPRVARVRLEGCDIVVTHGDQLGVPTPAGLHEAFPEADIIVFGHTHTPVLELLDRTVTVMNPGSAGPKRFSLPVSLGIMELEPGLPPRARLVTLALD